MNIGQAIRETVVEFKQHPYDINCGNCEIFAKSVCAKVKGAEIVWTMDLEYKEDFDGIDMTKWSGNNHCVIRHNGKWYDAEEPNGVLSPTMLPFYNRIRQMSPAS